ncbi:hypothetical protein FRC03_003800 [Tulasnella sp. 419]|nr:hypothetical protein FRC03_003800 [Tulasnella sp. 419]
MFLDYSGIIVNLAILVICAVALLLTAIRRDAKERYPTKSQKSKSSRNSRRLSTVSEKSSRKLSDTGATGDIESGIGLQTEPKKVE